MLESIYLARRRWDFGNRIEDNELMHKLEELVEFILSNYNTISQENNDGIDKDAMLSLIKLRRNLNTPEHKARWKKNAMT